MEDIALTQSCVLPKMMIKNYQKMALTHLEWFLDIYIDEVKAVTNNKNNTYQAQQSQSSVQLADEK